MLKKYVAIIITEFSYKVFGEASLNIQLNSVITNSVVNEHSIMTNGFLGQIGRFTT